MQFFHIRQKNDSKTSVHSSSNIISNIWRRLLYYIGHMNNPDTKNTTVQVTGIKRHTVHTDDVSINMNIVLIGHATCVKMTDWVKHGMMTEANGIRLMGCEIVSEHMESRPVPQGMHCWE